MEVVYKTERSDLATVYVARSESGQLLEFVESCQPPLNRDQKWVLIISTLFGCPVNCKICDAGGNYKGRLSSEELQFQVDHLIRERYPDGDVKSKVVKIQFARMGEPAFNRNVLGFLDQIPGLYRFRKVVPSLSTIAPTGCEDFFNELTRIKRSKYPYDFQMQFSVHSTSPLQRDKLIPVKKWNFERMARFGRDFYNEGGKKITLNFAMSKDTILDPAVLREHFDPGIFLVKITPVNPTYRAIANGIESQIGPSFEDNGLLAGIRNAGFEVILSIGEWEENLIGSNCGQFIEAINRNSQGFVPVVKDEK